MRPTPYTEKGLARLKCVRCGGPATEQWLVRSCRAGVNWGYLPLCDDCDGTLNEMVLDFFSTLERKSDASR